MTYRGSATVHHLVPLGADLVLDFAALGEEHPVVLSAGMLTWTLPGVRWNDGQPRSVAPRGFEAVPGESLTAHWSHASNNERTQSGAGMLANLAISLDAQIAVYGDDDDGAPAGTRVVPPYAKELVEWVLRFERWLATITNQPLDPLRPRPSLLNPRENSILTWVRDSDGTNLTNPQVGTRELAITVRGHGPARWHEELIADSEVVREAVRRTNQHESPSVVAVLWARAREAFAVGDYRTAVVDLGSIAEAALVAHDPQHRQSGTLGQKLRRVTAQRPGLVPSDADVALCRLRNDVLHDARTATRAEAERAGEIVLDVARPVLRYLDLVLPTSPEPAHRPQRADLTIFTSGR